MIPGLTQCPRRRSRQQQQQQQGSEAPRSSRSSSSSSSSSHHFHHHNHHHQHHHHHVHNHQSSNRPRVSRTQIIDSETPLADPGFSNPSDPGSNRAPPDADRFTRARMPLIAQRRSEASEAHRAAVEARTRLDERLREAAFLGRRNPDHSLPMLAHQYFNALFSEDEDEHLVWDEEHEWEASFSEWITGRVPGLRESWGSWANDLPTTGLSRASISALPREIFQARSKLQQQEELVDCSVCLESFKPGETLLRLPCRHKFHQGCITPWLETHDQCPYCRAKIMAGAGAGAGAASSSSRNELENEDNLLSWLEAFETGMSRRFTLNS